jgi:copper(I)-binding protein
MEVHRMSMDKGVMAMREIPGVTIPARGEVSMARGSKEGYHLMLMNLNRPLKEGEKFPVTLIFKNAGEVTVEIEVEKRSGAEHGHHTGSHKSGATQGHKH